jgi:transcriptional regulator with XRE-family HTH domain
MKYFEIINTLIAERKITDAILCKECGLNHGAVYQWRKGVEPTVSVILRVADYFNVSLDYLAGRSVVSNTEFSPEIKERIDFIRNNIDAMGNIGNECYQGFIKSSSEIEDMGTDIMDIAETMETNLNEMIRFIKQNSNNKQKLQFPPDIVKMWQKLNGHQQDEIRGEMKGYVKSNDKGIIGKAFDEGENIGREKQLQKSTAKSEVAE